MPPASPAFNATNLVPGWVYRVVKPFDDYDRRTHLPGETWRFLSKNFLPYEDGLTLQVEQAGQTIMLRLQWRPESQGEIIDRFSEYVEALPGQPAVLPPVARPKSRKGPAWLAALLGIGLVLLAVAVLYLLNRYRLPNTPSGSNPGPNAVAVEVVAPLSVKTLDPFLIEVQFKNNTGQPQTVESIGFDTHYLEGARLNRSDPPYERLTRMTLSVEFFVYEFNQTIPARGSLTIRHYLKAARPGDYAGQVMVCLNGDRPCSIYPARTLIGN